MTTMLQPEMVADLGVAMGYTREAILTSLVDDCGLLMQEAQDVLARAEEVRLPVGE